MNGAVDVGARSPKKLRRYARACAILLARAHAQNRSAAISAYMGRSGSFDRAIARWANAYARQVAWDFAAFDAAVASGRLPVQPGI
jgi:hypothetical protein